MIVGLGLDIVEIERVQGMLDRWGDRFLRKVFTEKEIDYCNRYGSSADHFAGRFAAKEAAMKALGVGWGASAVWHEVEVLNEESGKPVLSMKGGTAGLAEELGVRAKHVSISHSQTSACAVVVLGS